MSKKRGALHYCALITSLAAFLLFLPSCGDTNDDASEELTDNPGFTEENPKADGKFVPNPSGQAPVTIQGVDIRNFKVYVNPTTAKNPNPEALVGQDGAGKVGWGPADPIPDGIYQFTLPAGKTYAIVVFDGTYTYAANMYIPGNGKILKFKAPNTPTPPPLPPPGPTRLIINLWEDFNVSIRGDSISLYGFDNREKDESMIPGKFMVTLPAGGTYWIRYGIYDSCFGDNAVQIKANQDNVINSLPSRVDCPWDPWTNEECAQYGGWCP